MNRVNSVLRLHRRDIGTWVGIPWLILGVSFSINLALAALVTDTSFTTGGMTSVHIGALIVGIVATSQTFPFAVGLGVRRTDFFVGTFATAVLLHAGTALALTLLSVVESNMSGVWGGRVNFFHLPFLGLAPPRLFALHFMVLLALFAAGCFTYSVFSRYRWLGMTSGALVGVVLLTVIGFLIGKNDAWQQAIAWLLDAAAWPLRLVPVVFLLTLFSYWLMRRSTV